LILIPHATCVGDGTCVLQFEVHLARPARRVHLNAIVHFSHQPRHAPTNV
jgi:hypothetical protein